MKLKENDNDEIHIYKCIIDFEETYSNEVNSITFSYWIKLSSYERSIYMKDVWICVTHLIMVIIWNSIKDIIFVRHTIHTLEEAT